MTIKIYILQKTQRQQTLLDLPSPLLLYIILVQCAYGVINGPSRRLVVCLDLPVNLSGRRKLSQLVELTVRMFNSGSTIYATSQRVIYRFRKNN